MSIEQNTCSTDHLLWRMLYIQSELEHVPLSSGWSLLSSNLFRPCAVERSATLPGRLCHLLTYREQMNLIAVRVQGCADGEPGCRY